MTLRGLDRKILPDSNNPPEGLWPEGRGLLLEGRIFLSRTSIKGHSIDIPKDLLHVEGKKHWKNALGPNPMFFRIVFGPLNPNFYTLQVKNLKCREGFFYLIMRIYRNY